MTCREEFRSRRSSDVRRESDDYFLPPYGITATAYCCPVEQVLVRQQRGGPRRVNLWFCDPYTEPTHHPIRNWMVGYGNASCHLAFRSALEFTAAARSNLPRLPLKQSAAHRSRRSLRLRYSWHHRLPAVHHTGANSRGCAGRFIGTCSPKVRTLSGGSVAGIRGRPNSGRAQTNSRECPWYSNCANPPLKFESHLLRVRIG